MIAGLARDTSISSPADAQLEIFVIEVRSHVPGSSSAKGSEDDLTEFLRETVKNNCRVSSLNLSSNNNNRCWIPVPSAMPTAVPAIRDLHLVR